MESFLQLLLVLAFIYWTTLSVTPRDRAGWPPERPRIIGRLASTPGPERRGDGGGDGGGGGDGDYEDGAGLQPSIERVFRSPSPQGVLDQHCDDPGTPVRASTRTTPRATPARGAGLSTPPPSNRVRRASVSSTASRRSVRWATESGDEDAKPIVVPRGARASIVVTPSSCKVTSTGPSMSSSMVFRSSNMPASSSSSQSNPSSSRLGTPTSTFRPRSVTPTPSTLRAVPSTPAPSVSSPSHIDRMTPVSSSSRTARMTPAPSASRASKMMARATTPNDEFTSNRAPSIASRSVSVASMASTISTWSQNKRILDVYDRQFVWFKNLANTMLENGEPAGTGWFESESDSEITAPPDFSGCKDVCVGDVFCHRTPTCCQLWLWTQPVDGILPDWQHVEVGCRRWDGRKLSITKGRRRPSWVL